MLVLTKNATEAIGTLIDRPELPVGAGLRISASSNADEPLAVATAPVPEAEDAVVEAEGARVFLDATAAVALDDKVLDAQTTDQGAVRFMLGAQ